MYKRFLHSQYLVHKGQDRLGVNRTAVLWTLGHLCQKKTCSLFLFFFLIYQDTSVSYNLKMYSTFWNRNCIFLLWNGECHQCLAHRAGSLLLPHVYSGEVPPRSAVFVAAELAQHHSKGAVSQAHDCLSAGKRAVCAMWSGHWSWKIRRSPFAVGWRRLMFWKCSWAIIEAYFSRDAGMLGNCAYFDLMFFCSAFWLRIIPFPYEPELQLEPG